MEIQEELINNVMVFRLKGKLDSNTSEQFEESLMTSIDKGCKDIVIDCNTLDYVSSAGLRVLFLAAKKLKGVNGKIVLASVKPHIKEVLEIAGFSTIFPVFSDTSEAIEQICP